MYSLLIVSFVEWTGATQRPNHEALGLARRGWQVTYASPGYLHRRRGRVASGLTLPRSLRIAEPAQLPGASRNTAVARINRWWFERSLRRLSATPWDVVLFNDPRHAAWIAQLPARLRVLDYMDDLSATLPDPRQAGSMEAHALTVADRVWTGTASLADRLAPQRPDARFIPCGVDGALFAHPDAASIEAARADLPPGDGPLAGYFGVINERFDVRLIQALLDSGPWRILLIGPATSRAPQLPRTPRLRWIGPRAYCALPGYLAHFDLGLIPYDTQGPHRFLYPVKALEYLAGGRPVLSTPLPDVVRFLGDFVELAEGREAWQRAGAALLADRSHTAARARAGQAQALTRSWDAMIDEMETILTGALKPEHGA